jgi:16S rRNA (guanine1207-N2)-methyltransferase
MISSSGLYGAPDPALVGVAPGALQFSPLSPGSARLEDQGEGSLQALTVLAPPGAVERRYVLAHALRALAPGGVLTALAPKAKGGSRLKGELEAFGCAVTEDARRHHRICRCPRPAAPVGLDEALAEGGLRYSDSLGLWTQPGVFSWDRIDPGSALLARALSAPALAPLAGDGADLGCGIGVLALAALKSPAVKSLRLIDLDRRALDAARRNVTDPRARFDWADARDALPGLEGLDFVVMNPPFHEGGAQDHALGIAFVAAAARALRRGGICWLVANRHLPYEAALGERFKTVTRRADEGGYKVYEAVK